jgi:hypothetical protein
MPPEGFEPAIPASERSQTARSLVSAEIELNPCNLASYVVPINSTEQKMTTEESFMLELLLSDDSWGKLSYLLTWEILSYSSQFEKKSQCFQPKICMPAI